MITKKEEIRQSLAIATRNLYRRYSDWLEEDADTYLTYLHQMVLSLKWEEDLDVKTFEKQWEGIKMNDMNLTHRFINLNVMDAAANRIHERVFA